MIRFPGPPGGLPQGIIDINFARVRQQASRLRHAAQAHRGDAAAVSKVADQVAGGWKDPAGARYVIAAKDLSKDMRDTADSLDRAADELTKIAAQYEGAMRKAAEAARAFGGGGSGGFR